METTFVVEEKENSYVFEVDYFKKVITVDLDGISYQDKLTDEELTNVENYEAETMIKNTKKSWNQLEKYLLKLIK